MSIESGALKARCASSQKGSAQTIWALSLRPPLWGAMLKHHQQPRQHGTYTQSDLRFPYRCRARKPFF